MEKYKQQGLAVVKIGEKILLLGIGVLALILSQIDPRFATMSLEVLIGGTVCLLFSLPPIIWAYIKTTYPTK